LAAQAHGKAFNSLQNSRISAASVASVSDCFRAATINGAQSPARNRFDRFPVRLLQKRRARLAGSVRLNRKDSLEEIKTGEWQDKGCD
jgi:hypothetical protein